MFAKVLKDDLTDDEVPHVNPQQCEAPPRKKKRRGFASLLKEAFEGFAPALKYDPEQPRDETGKWTADGASNGSSGPTDGPGRTGVRSDVGSTGLVLRERHADALSPVHVTHFSNNGDLSVLNAARYGSGIRGAESGRLARSTDDNIKHRVYFYLDPADGSLPHKESGLGNHVYRTTLANLYDLAKDPAGIFPKIKDIADQSARSNALESEIVKAGYDGYAVPAYNMAVVLGKDVPVTETVRKLAFSAVLKGQQPDIGMAAVLKYNPYHDERGRFTTGDNANYMSLAGKPYASKLKPPLYNGDGPAPSNSITMAAVNSAVAQANPKSWVHAGKPEGYPGGMVKQTYTYSFPTKAKANAALPSVMKALDSFGMEDHKGKPDHMTMDAPKLKGSTIAVTTYMKVKFTGAPTPTADDMAAAAAATEAKYHPKTTPLTLPPGEPSMDSAHPAVTKWMDKAKNAYLSGDTETLHAAVSMASQFVTPLGKKAYAYAKVLSAAHDENLAAEAAKPKTPNPKVPADMPAMPKVLGKINGYSSIHAGDMVEALNQGQKLFQSGNLDGLKAHAENTKREFTAGGYRTPNDEKLHAYLDTLATTLEQHQLKQVGTPTEQDDLFKKPKKPTIASTPEEQAKLEAAQAKAKAKHDAKMLPKAVEQYTQKHHDLMLAAADLNAQGKWSAGKAKLAQLDNAEKKLSQYGMAPDAINALKAKANGDFEAFKKAEQDKVQGLVTSIYAGKLHSEWNPYSSTEQTQKVQALMKQANAEYAAHPGLHKDLKGQYARNGEVTAKVAKVKATYDAAAAMTAALADPENPDKLAHAKALKATAEKEFGADSYEMSAAATKLKATDAPKTPEEALNAAKAKGLQFYEVKAGKYDFDGPYYGSSTKDLSNLHDAYDDAKNVYVGMGGNPNVFSTLNNELKQQGEASYATAKVEYTAHAQEHMDKLTEAAYQSVKTIHELGSENDATKAAVVALNEAMTAAKAGHLSESKQEAALSAGTGKYQLELQEKDATAKSKIKDALFSYYSKRDTLGPDHDDTHAAMAAAQAVTEQYAKDLHKPGGVDPLPGLKQEAKANVEKIKAAKAQAAAFAEKLKNLDSDAAAKVADFDAHAETFQYPYGDHTFEAKQRAEVKKLTPEQKSILSDYTGSGFTALNKEVGQYGTAKMQGKDPKPVGEYTKDRMLALDSAFEQVKLGQNVQLKRNMAQKYFFGQLGLPLDQVNGMSEAAMREAVVGKLYKETAYSSTSTREDFSGSYSSAAGNSGLMSLHIRAGKDLPGLYVDSFSKNAGENEVVLGRGTTYVIRDVHRSQYGGKWHFDVDAIGMYPDPL